MHKVMGLFLFGAITCCAAFCADQTDGVLQSKLASMAAKHHGKVAIWAKNLSTGTTVGIDADQPVQTASVIKLPIMIEAFHQAKSGRLNLSQRTKLTKENQVIGSGVLQFMDPGLEPTVKDVITLMMIESDNTATNMVIDLVGIRAVNQRAAAMGLKNTYLYKKVFKAPDLTDGPIPADQKKFGLGKTTAREMGAAMASIEQCEVGEPQLCRTMIGIMKNQQYRNMVPHYLETQDTSEQGSFVADKVGALDDVRNDVALVYTKAGPIVISAFTWDNKDTSWLMENDAELLIARMAKMIVDSWSPGGLGVNATKE